MTAPTTNAALTYEALLETPEGDGNRYELLGGEIFVTASPSKRHAWIATRIWRALDRHVEERSLGAVFGVPVDVRLTQFDVVVPDVFYVRNERMNLFGDHFFDGAPDLIIELLSPSTRARDLTTKLQLCARAGVPEYWIVDPETSAIPVYALSSQGGYELLKPEGTFRSKVLPELELNSAALFEGIE